MNTMQETDNVNNLKIGTLFSGIGAVEHALERMGIPTEIIFACDNDPFVKKSYFANYDISEERWFDDIRNFDATVYRNSIDLLVGGSPCQSFSIAGKRGGLDDTRGTLFYEYARVIKECSPKVFIYENVKGLINHDNGNTWRIIQDVFNELGYDIHYEVLNSRHYRIPQNRQRVFVVGFKTPRPDFSFPEKIPLEHTMQDFLEDYTDSKYFLSEKGVKFVTLEKNAKKRYTQINGDVALCQKRNQQMNWNGDFIFDLTDKPMSDEFVFPVKEVDGKYYLSEKMEEYVMSSGTKTYTTQPETDLPVARCLLQSMHKLHRAGVDNYVTHKGRIRKLTPRECLRLMGFQDSFKIVVSDTQMYRQSGNSIVVDVLIKILQQVNIQNYIFKT
jgi:DNA (cytosine-5)-methyltransferase 1